MPLMSKPRRKRDVQQPGPPSSPPPPATSGRSPREGENVNLWLDRRLGAVLRAYLDTARPRTTKTAVIEQALEEFFQRQGLWPPGGSEGG